ncbi:uncharacterized protein UTRI_04882 [Ustilago trichophora]|uniref:Uncharacterized protein n=1 Tax=Ustilago trichophora TaxID=86804 RepID=A0A5C3EEN7_9BASI|nr:uncharacterized protein UTRI_04882 [Ustilago trichophora]
MNEDAASALLQYVVVGAPLAHRRAQTASHTASRCVSTAAVFQRPQKAISTQARLSDRSPLCTANFALIRTKKRKEKKHIAKPSENVERRSVFPDCWTACATYASMWREMGIHRSMLVAKVGAESMNLFASLDTVPTESR